MGTVYHARDEQGVKVLQYRAVDDKDVSWSVAVEGRRPRFVMVAAGADQKRARLSVQTKRESPRRAKTIVIEVDGVPFGYVLKARNRGQPTWIAVDAEDGEIGRVFGTRGAYTYTEGDWYVVAGPIAESVPLRAAVLSTVWLIDRLRIRSGGA